MMRTRREKKRKSISHILHARILQSHRYNNNGMPNAYRMLCINKNHISRIFRSLYRSITSLPVCLSVSLCECGNFCDDAFCVRLIWVPHPFHFTLPLKSHVTLGLFDERFAIKTNITRMLFVLNGNFNMESQQ